MLCSNAGSDSLCDIYKQQDEEKKERLDRTMRETKTKMRLSLDIQRVISNKMGMSGA